MRRVYSLLTYLWVPLYAGWMLWRGLRERGWWAHFSERFGFGARIAIPGSIWLHAVSVGEVQSAAELVRALAERYPRRPLVFTTVTPAGAERARALFRQGVQVRCLPFDLPGSVRRFFERVRPGIAIVLETEIWPNLFHACARRGVPVLLASARLSERSVRRYRWVSGLIRATLSEGVVVAAQSDGDAARFRAIGAPAELTSVAGSLKFDLTLAPDTAARGAQLRRDQAPGRPMWIAGSTHAGEERSILDAHRRTRERLPDALLVLAPRHARRFAEVALWLEQQGVVCSRRSSGAAVPTETEVLLLDTLGELVTYYAAGDVAFVGGSLVPIGGHNLLEPAAVGRPVLTGPYYFNAPEAARLLLDAGAARVVVDAAALAEALVALLLDGAQRARIGALGRDAIERNRGTVGRVLTLLAPLIATA
jgi:3-deoxy-D-manno-octulosonic-acid transferase